MNIAPTQPGRWDSPLLPLPAPGVNISVAATHGRGTVPRQTHWVYVCLQRGDLGYEPGDEVDILGYYGTVQPVTWANAVQVGFAHAAGTWAISVQRKDGTNYASLTNTRTRWALKCYCDW